MNIAPAEFEYLQNMVRDRTAIIIEAGKEYLAEMRLAPVSAQAGYASVQQLLQALRSRPFDQLHSQVLEAMTNNETWFFRDFEPFNALKKVVIPALMQKRASERKLTFWSAACSSGQEPYSIAMLLKEHFNLPGWSFSIKATDICSRVLDRAQSGRYSQMEINRGMPATLLAKYFQKNGLDWDIKPEIRNSVSFQKMNLVEPWPVLPSADIVFLRNVLIYFDVETRKQILERVRRVLRPDGYLFLGGAETTLNIDDKFQRVQFEKTAYYCLQF